MPGAVSKPKRILLGLALLVAVLMAASVLPEYFPDHREASTAIYDGDIERLTLLLDRGLDPNTTSQWSSQIRRLFANPDDNLLLAPAKDPLLLIALHHGEPAMARLLLEHGADPNAKDPYGASALAVAAGGDDPETVRMLLSLGADPSTAGGVRPTNTEILRLLAPR